MTTLTAPAAEFVGHFEPLSPEWHAARADGIGGSEIAGLVVRFMAKVEQQDSGCWLWRGSVNRVTGYAQIKVGPRVWSGHRLSYVLFVGPVPFGLQLDHLCRTRHCVSPLHLEPVTARENTARSANDTGQALRTGKCKWGHEFTPENTRVRRNGSRACVECARRRCRETYQRARSVAS